MLHRVGVVLLFGVMLAMSGFASGQVSTDEAYRRLQERDASHNPRQLAATRASTRPGTVVVFVCDASGSMHQNFWQERDLVASELSKLRETDQFEIICFQGQSYSIMHERLVKATTEGKAEAVQFLNRVDAKLETNPIPALSKAFKFKPDLIFFISDGDVPDNTAVLELIHTAEALHKTTINTVALIDDVGTDKAFVDFLRQIASGTGGAYRRARQSAPEFALPTSMP